MSAPVILIDGSSYLFRAFHALPPLTNAEGHPTGAIYGVTNMIGKLLETYDPQCVAVVFDAKGKTFRNDLYEDYKAHRPPMPDDLRVQIEPIHQIVAAMGLPLLVVEGVEADDVIGTLAARASQAEKETLISTGDKDMAQLVNEHVTLINTMNNSFSTPETVLEKFGVRPDQIIDYLALIGDSADNIPGVPKCGPKTAAKWLGEYETLENLVANAEQIKGKIGESLRAFLPELPLSKQLATIKTDCELPFALDGLKRQKPDTEKLKELFAEYGFKAWLSLLEEGKIPFSAEAAAAGKPAKAPTRSGSVAAPVAGLEIKPLALEVNPYETILSKSQLEAWISKLKSAEVFAFDTETDSLDAMQANLVGMSFALETADGKIDACYLPLGHDYEGAPEQLDLQETLAQLKPILEAETPKKIGQNLKYDWHILMNYGIRVGGMAFDTMLESYVLNSTATRHNMDALADFYLHKSTHSFEEIAGKGKKQKTFNQIELEQAAVYAAEDADITLQLHKNLQQYLSAQPGLVSVFEKIEMPLLPVLAQMERDGILIDKQQLADQSHELSLAIDSLQQQAYELAGEEFNLNSPKQLQEILFDKLQLPVLKKTPKGAPSTAEPVLQEMADQGLLLPALIIEYRSLAKLKSTYTDALPKQINPQTGRVHTSYQQAVASTGRLSSTDPNLQNIPVRTKEGRKIREAFITRSGYSLVAADYSQIELRIMAHLSADPGLMAAFEQGLDVHKATAAEIFNEDLDKVTADQRRSAKAVNFGLIYGMSAFGLSKQLDIERGLAQNYIDRYFARYPGVKTYMSTTKEDAKQQGFVATLLGRRLHLPEINASNGILRQAAERLAINAPMQGSAADIIKLAMIEIAAWIKTSNLDVKMLMQVHDELVFEVKNEDLAAAIPEIKKRMEGVFELAVPLIVDIGTGENWNAAH